jgi:site-specific recombinase XerD
LEVAVSDVTPVPAVHSFDPASILARDAFLRRYTGETRKLYGTDLRLFFDWCAQSELDPLAARRLHLEEFAEHLATVRRNKPVSVRRRLQTLKSFFALAYADELIDRDPTVMLRMPKVHKDPERLVWLDRFQVGQLLHAAGEESPDHHALLALMAMLGLRVSAACRARIEDVVVDEHGTRRLRVVEKGARTHTTPIPPQVWEIIQRAIGDRTEGPIVRRRNGNAQDRNGAYWWVRILSRKAGLPERAHPHSLRRAAIRTLIDAGVTIEEVCHFAGHADVRTTLGYHPARGAHGVHAVYVAAAAFDLVA